MTKQISQLVARLLLQWTFLCLGDCLVRLWLLQGDRGIEVLT